MVKQVISKLFGSSAEAQKTLAKWSMILGFLYAVVDLGDRYLVTKVRAKEMILEAEQKFTVSQKLMVKSQRLIIKQTNSNTAILTEMRLMRLESKMAEGKSLTPTEKRVYAKLLKQYNDDLNISVD